MAPAAQRAPAKTAGETESYAGSILTADAVTLGLLTAAAVAGTPELALLGLGPYLIVPPIIHGVKGNGGGAALSALTRVGVPFVTSAVAAELVKEPRCPLPDEDPDEWRCDRQEEHFVLGFGLGMLTAMALDATLLARRPVPKREAVVMVPSATWSKNGGWSLGVQGRF